MQHQNLVEALAAFDHGDYFFIVFELAQCTLGNYLDGLGGVTYASQDLWAQVQGLASGLAYLHGRKVAGGRQDNGKMYHLDLKPSNVLIFNGTMKIADFGLSNYKPEPRPMESMHIDNSQHAGIGLYAPPAGRVSDKYDVYSLGTILSEIACFDVGKETRVRQYREKRLRDAVDVHENDKSIRFYYPRTDRLKHSVLQEHSDILESVEESKRGSTGISLQPWQESFYSRDLFELIEKMLHESALQRPFAANVSTNLDSHIRQASRATRGSLPYELNIWESTVKGTVPVDDDAEPPDMLYRLYVLGYRLPYT